MGIEQRVDVLCSVHVLLPDCWRRAVVGMHIAVPVLCGIGAYSCVERCDLRRLLWSYRLNIALNVVEGNSFDILAVKAGKADLLNVTRIRIIGAHPLDQVEHLLSAPHPFVELLEQFSGISAPGQDVVINLLPALQLASIANIVKPIFSTRNSRTRCFMVKNSCEPCVASPSPTI